MHVPAGFDSGRLSLRSESVQVMHRLPAPWGVGRRWWETPMVDAGVKTESLAANGAGEGPGIKTGALMAVHLTY